MLRTFLAAVAIAALMTGTALADDPIVGNWRTDSGETAAIAGASSFAITLKTGKYKGKRIGTLKADGDGKYSGQITDPKNDKTYSGSAALSGNALKMSGCVLGGLICRSQNWKRQ